MSWERELGRTALFAGLPEDILAELSSRAVHRKYRRDSVVFVQGEFGRRCYTLLTGSVKISAYAPDGREAVLAVLGPGDVFGELSLFDDAPRSADATVIEEAELLSLDDAALTEAARHHPDLALSLLRVLARRLRRANERFQDAAFFDVTGRVAKRLADLAGAHGVEDADGMLVDVPLSQESLANMIGATRESVNKALSGLTRRGLVRRRGQRYVITDVEELRDRAR